MDEITLNQTLVKKVEQATPPEIVAALANFQQQLVALFPGEIEQIILYDSYATGQATPDSDVEVMIVIPWRDPTQLQNYYLAGPGDPHWQQIVNLVKEKNCKQRRLGTIIIQSMYTRRTE